MSKLAAERALAASAYIAQIRETAAGAYARPLFSSTSAVSDAKYTLHTPYFPLSPPVNSLNNP